MGMVIPASKGFSSEVSSRHSPHPLKTSSHHPGPSASGMQAVLATAPRQGAPCEQRAGKLAARAMTARCGTPPGHDGAVRRRVQTVVHAPVAALTAPRWRWCSATWQAASRVRLCRHCTPVRRMRALPVLPLKCSTCGHGRGGRISTAGHRAPAQMRACYIQAPAGLLHPGVSCQHQGSAGAGARL